MTGRRSLLAAFLLILPRALCAAPPPPHPLIPTPGTLDGLGVEIHFMDPKPGEMEMITAAGFKWVRMDMTWGHIEYKKGVYDFSAYDHLIDVLTRYKLHAVFILGLGNKLYADPSETKDPFTGRVATPEFREAYARWVVATVKRYSGRGFLWEIWNEPNIPGFWRPRSSVTDYVALAKVAMMALRDAGLCKDNHSGEALIGPASNTIDLPFLEACFKGGLLNYWCAVSVHPYRPSTPESVAEDYHKLRALIARYAPDSQIPVLSAEWGYSTASGALTEDRQASYLARELLTNITNRIPLSIWYDWHDDGDDAANVRAPLRAGAAALQTGRQSCLRRQALL